MPMTTLMAVAIPGDRFAVTESPKRDLDRVSELCDHWGMKLNMSKSEIMLASRPRTMHPQCSDLYNTLI